MLNNRTWQCRNMLQLGRDERIWEGGNERQGQLTRGASASKTYFNEVFLLLDFCFL